jgi:hypothetical protein
MIGELYTLRIVSGMFFFFAIMDESLHESSESRESFDGFYVRDERGAVRFRGVISLQLGFRDPGLNELDGLCWLETDGLVVVLWDYSAG